MEIIKDEISKERYDQLKALDYSGQHKELFPDGVPNIWAYGYGYYGHYIYEENGKYYVQHRIGDTCD